MDCPYKSVCRDYDLSTKILASVKFKRKSVEEIHLETNIPRSKIYIITRRLVELGFLHVEKIKVLQQMKKLGRGTMITVRGYLNAEYMRD